MVVSFFYVDLISLFFVTCASMPIGTVFIRFGHPRMVIGEQFCNIFSSFLRVRNVIRPDTVNLRSKKRYIDV